MRVKALKVWFWKRAYLDLGAEYTLPDEEARVLIEAGAVEPVDVPLQPRPIVAENWRARRGRNRVQA